MEMTGRRLFQAEKTADVKVSTGVCLAHSRSGLERGWEETKDMRSEEQQDPMMWDQEGTMSALACTLSEMQPFQNS